MKIKFGLLVLVLTIIVTNGNAEVVKWSEAAGGNGHYYTLVFVGERISWQDANNEAKEKGGYLATITSAAESDFVFENLVNDSSLFVGSGNGSGPWLGGYQDLYAADYSEPSGGWRWVTGEDWDYTNWYPDQPDDQDNIEHFLHYSCYGYEVPQPLWNDQRNETTENWCYVIAYVMESALVPEPSFCLMFVTIMILFQPLLTRRKRVA